MSVMRGVVRRLSAIWDQVESWGLRIPRATADVGPRVHVYGPGRDGKSQLIGTLSQERGVFIFRYRSDYASSPGAEPISAFPDLNEVYESAELWPFFAVRIPPSERSDVRAALKERGLRPEQTLEVLGTMAKRSISNPYQLDLQMN
jgi:HipA-like protein